MWAITAGRATSAVGSPAGGAAGSDAGADGAGTLARTAACSGSFEIDTGAASEVAADVPPGTGQTHCALRRLCAGSTGSYTRPSQPAPADRQLCAGSSVGKGALLTNQAMPHLRAVCCLTPNNASPCMPLHTWFTQERATREAAERAQLQRANKAARLAARQRVSEARRQEQHQARLPEKGRSVGGYMHCLMGSLSSRGVKGQRDQPWQQQEPAPSLALAATLPVQVQPPQFLRSLLASQASQLPARQSVDMQRGAAEAPQRRLTVEEQDLEAELAELDAQLAGKQSVSSCPALWACAHLRDPLHHPAGKRSSGQSSDTWETAHVPVLPVASPTVPSSPVRPPPQHNEPLQSLLDQQLCWNVQQQSFAADTAPSASSTQDENAAGTNFVVGSHPTERKQPPISCSAPRPVLPPLHMPLAWYGARASPSVRPGVKRSHVPQLHTATRATERITKRAQQLPVLGGAWWQPLAPQRQQQQQQQWFWPTPHTQPPPQPQWTAWQQQQQQQQQLWHCWWQQQQQWPAGCQGWL